MKSSSGFMEGKSTSALRPEIHLHLLTLKDIVFLDFTKALDSVPHERLPLKLNGYGIEGNLLYWFRNFLANRQQRVIVRVPPPHGLCQTWSSLGKNSWSYPIPHLCERYIV